MKVSVLIQGKGDIIRIGETEPISAAVKLLHDKRIGAVLVENAASEIVGILSERDLVRGMSLHGADLHDVAVAELMTTQLIRCAPDDSINQAMAKMTDRRIRHLPVFDGEDLVGLVSIGDLVKFRIDEIQTESDALRAYINS